MAIRGNFLLKFFGLKKLLITSLLFTTPLVQATSSFEIPSLEALGSKKWVKEKLETYPELTWLLDKNVQHTQEGKVEQFSHSWSKQLTESHYPEFERTILSLVCLYLIADGSDAAYERFTNLQSPAEKLTHESFKNLHHFAQAVIKNDSHILQALEINLILGDMGKTKIAHQKAEKFGISEADYDLFLDECLAKCPEIFPTFQLLSPPFQKQIKEAKGLVHLGHVTHVEGGPEILTKLKRSGILNKNPHGFDFELLTHICDMSAARGHEDNSGSKVMTENTFRTILAIKDALHYLANHTELEALQKYLFIRAEWLGLDKTLEEVSILARIGAMMRLFTKEDGTALTKALLSLKTSQNVDSLSELNPLVYREERTPTYVPAVLVNLMGAYIKQGLSRDAAITKCVQKGLPLIASILYAYRHNKANQLYNPNLTLNFNKAAGQLRDAPDLAEKATFSIDAQGNIDLNSSLEKK